MLFSGELHIFQFEFEQGVADFSFHLPALHMSFAVVRVCHFNTRGFQRVHLDILTRLGRVCFHKDFKVESHFARVNHSDLLESQRLITGKPECFKFGNCCRELRS